MNRFFRGLAAASLAVAVSGSLAAPLAAQSPTNFRDTSILKPPAGAKVAVVEFEDLECPACSNAAPIVHRAVAQYHIPLVRYDFPLQMHIWSRDAAITARWMQETPSVGPAKADEFRAAVFAAQISIASKDDLARFTRKFAASHGIALPFSVDPTGKYAAMVQADYNKGLRLNVEHTPTIVVVTANHYDEVVGDANQINGKIEAALASTRGSATSHKTAAKKK